MNLLTTSLRNDIIQALNKFSQIKLIFGNEVITLLFVMAFFIGAGC
jgi:TolB-like protein